MKFNLIYFIPVFLAIVNLGGSMPIVPFPSITVGGDIIKYTEAFLAAFVSLVESKLPTAKILGLLPALSLDFNLKVVEPFAKDLPNYNTEFPVKGLDEGKVKWLVEAENRTKEDPVLLYSHGGAYVVGVLPVFPYLWTRLYQALENDRLSILLLDYTTTANGAKYPTQLKEIASTYNQLAKTSDNIIVGGDSAGAHLSLSLIRHSEFPISGVPDVEGESLTGGIFISPWLNIYPDDTTGSHEYNNGKDILTSKLLRESALEFVTSKELLTAPETNFYNDTEADWENILPKNVFSSYGEREILLTDDISWYKLAGLSGDQVFEDLNAIHDAIIFTPEKSDVFPKIVEFFKRNY